MNIEITVDASMFDRMMADLPVEIARAGDVRSVIRPDVDKMEVLA